MHAPAKINLSLLIAGRRPDGFHEIETIMAKVNWYDEILFQKTKQHGIEFICNGPHWAPQGRENLVYRAAEMLLDECLADEGVQKLLATLREAPQTDSGITLAATATRLPQSEHAQLYQLVMLAQQLLGVEQKLDLYRHDSE